MSLPARVLKWKLFGVDSLSEQIDIPATAFEPKPLFPDRPGPASAKKIRDWIKMEAPWLWRGHTHSRPDKAEAEKIRYIAEFELPNKAEAPCPNCRPKSGKFSKVYSLVPGHRLRAPDGPRLFQGAESRRGPIRQG